MHFSLYDKASVSHYGNNSFHSSIDTRHCPACSGRRALVQAQIAGCLICLLRHVDTALWWTYLSHKQRISFVVDSHSHSGLMQPKGEPKSSQLANIYVGLGSLAGLLVGLAVNARFMLLCLCLGAIFGFAAYCKTPAGRWLKFPGLTFIQYFCNKCLPIVITFAMIGISIEGFLVK